METMTCQKCDGDGYLDIMDPGFSGAVIGARPCPVCDGTGSIDIEAEAERVRERVMEQIKKACG